MLRFLNQKTIINLGVLLLIFAIDRFSKIYIVQKNLNGLSSEIKLNNFLSLDLVWNKGVAFGLFSTNSLAFYNALTILILIIILIVLYLSFTSSCFKKIWC